MHIDTADKGSFEGWHGTAHSLFIIHSISLLILAGPVAFLGLRTSLSCMSGCQLLMSLSELAPPHFYSPTVPQTLMPSMGLIFCIVSQWKIACPISVVLCGAETFLENQHR